MPAMQTDPAHSVVEFLADNNADCPACNHALRGIPEPICPECGTPLELGVRAPGIRHSGWVAALIACAMGLGFDSVVVLVMAWNFLVQLFTGHLAQLPREFWVLTFTLLPLALSCLGAIALLWRKRHPILRLSGRGQIIFAVSAFVVIGGLHAAIGVWLIATLFI